MNNKVTITKLLKEYKENMIFERSTYFHGSNLYNINVKLYDAFNYDEDIILNNIKKNNKNLSDRVIEKTKNYLEEQSDEDVDQLFWSYVNFIREDATNLAMYNSDEVNCIRYADIEPSFTGNNGGYFGFDIDPEDTLSDFEEDFDYIKNNSGTLVEENTLIDELTTAIHLLKQINRVMLDVKKQSESISTNDIIEDYIISNEIDNFEEEIVSEDNIAKFKKENSKEIKKLEEKAKKNNISIRII